MTGKQTILAGVGILLLIGATTVGVFYLVQYRNTANSTLDTSTTDSGGIAGSLTPSTADAIQLNGQNNSVPDSSSPKSTQSEQKNQAQSAPTPEMLKSYEQYTDKKEVYFADIVAGSAAGAVAEPGKRAAVYYKGWLTDGTLFDQSKTDDKGALQPFVFEIGGGQVIKGWDQGILGMRVGGVRRLIVPPSLGYGAAGIKDVIPPNALLIFDIELLATQ